MVEKHHCLCICASLSVMSIKWQAMAFRDASITTTVVLNCIVLNKNYSYAEYRLNFSTDFCRNLTRLHCLLVLNCQWSTK